MEHEDARRSGLSKEADIAAPVSTSHQQKRGSIKHQARRTFPEASVFWYDQPWELNNSMPFRVPVPSVSHEEYSMGHQERGVALIFSHKNFVVRQHSEGEYQPDVREGTEVDRDAFRQTFTMLGFRVECFNDLCHQEIKRELGRVAEQDHNNRDCVAVVVLSHCEKDGKLCAKDRDYHVSELWEPFTPRHCPSLDGKPKLFFIQVSRGRGLELGVNISSLVNDASDDGRDSYADILVSHSAFDGVTPGRDTPNTSRFVQTLHDELEAHRGAKDLVSLLTDVNRIVVQQVRLRTDRERLQQGRQLQPCFTSTLTRRVYFR